MIRILLSVILVLSFSNLARADARLDEARALLEKWVQTRQLIAREKRDWEVQKESLAQQIQLLEKEAALLDDQIKNAEATASRADTERQELIEENDTLQLTAKSVKAALPAWEQRINTLARSFPSPLTERIEPLLRRMPQDPETTRLSLSQRLQNVIGILSEVDKFNSSITIVGELRKNPADADVQVTTVYLGLAQAFFVDKSGEYAGVGTPSPDGWQWTARNEIAADVARAIAIYENRQPAAFVTLPVIIE